MKRKKPPIALISVLVCSLLGLVIAGKSFSFYNKSGDEQQKQLEQEALDRERAKPQEKPSAQKNDPSAAVQAMKDQMKKPNGAPSAPIAGKGPEDSRRFKTAVPTVIMPDEAVQKPKPNTTAPSSLWYDKDK